MSDDYQDPEVEQLDTIRPEADYEENGAMAPLWAAFAKAQGAFEPLKKTKHVRVKTKSGDFYEFDYAPLEEVLGSCLPALNANELGVLQPYSGLAPGKVLRTMLVHSSGATLTLKVRVPQQDTMQGLGSTLTYLRRYSVQCLLGVNAEDDDDGNVADGNQATASSKAKPPARQVAPTSNPDAMQPATRKRLIELARAAGFQSEDLKAFFLRNFNEPLASVDALLEVTAQKLIEALEALKVQK